MRLRGTIAASALLLAAAPAFAADEDDGSDAKYFFYHKAGADRAQVLADLEECRDLASAVEPPRAGYVYTPTVAAAAAAGFVQGLIRGAQRRHMGDAALRKCFGVKGYSRYEMTKEEAKQLYAGGWKEMRERLADKAIGPAPAGEALPQ